MGNHNIGFLRIELKGVAMRPFCARNKNDVVYSLLTWLAKVNCAAGSVSFYFIVRAGWTLTQYLTCLSY